MHGLSAERLSRRRRRRQPRPKRGYAEDRGTKYAAACGPARTCANPGSDCWAVVEAAEDERIWLGLALPKGHPKLQPAPPVRAQGIHSNRGQGHHTASFVVLGALKRKPALVCSRLRSILIVLASRSTFPQLSARISPRRAPVTESQHGDRFKGMILERHQHGLDLVCLQALDFGLSDLGRLDEAGDVAGHQFNRGRRGHDATLCVRD